ncbi:unnamed protein product [Symbiodinium natans]|uniref:Uncharacterized protein n=1 Tax=Symbiodinium natans TaxID=878477 RepID=A0A812IK11_9DINO|nr:unnamed protein product [Symbiodinium natans]
MKRSAHVAGIANIQNGIISLQLENLSIRPSPAVGLKGDWNPTAEAALQVWLSSPKKGFKQQADERTLAITDAPATSTLAIVDTPDTKNLAIRETPDPKTSTTVDNNKDNTNDDGAAPASSSGSSSSSSSSGSDSSMPKTKRGLRARVKKLEATNSQLKAALEETTEDLFWANEALRVQVPSCPFSQSSHSPAMSVWSAKPPADFTQACLLAAPLDFRALDAPVIHARTSELGSFDMLPLKAATHSTSVKSLVELVKPMSAGDFDFGHLHHLISTAKYEDLPGPCL